MIRKLLNPKVRILPAMLAFLLLSGTAFPQMYITNNTTMKVQEGTLVSDGGNLNLDANSTLTNNGTMYVKGNLTNNNTTDNSLGAGTFEFNGTTAQTISGPNVFGTLIINNASGVSLTGSYNNTVSTGLTLASGRLDLGSTLSLLLGPSVTSVGGTLNSSNMIVATGTGELRKEFSGNGSFTFPVGDNTSTAEYSPVSLAFASGTYPSGNYIGVNLVNSPYNPSVYTGSYLNRYWNLTNASASPITAFTANATFSYPVADVVGTETELYCTKVAPDPVVAYTITDNVNHILSASGLSSFSTFTGVRGAITARPAIMLQGPFSAGAMTTTLATLPLGTRSDDTKFPQEQPYNGSPWNYTGSEVIASIPANTVDWVLVDLRMGTDPSTAVFAARRAGLIKSDGSITDVDGISGLRFYNVAVPAGQNLYLVIRHRNHMPILAQAAASQNGDGEWTYNFTTGSDRFYPNTGAGCIQLSTSPVIWGMLSGDADNSGQIYLNDLNNYWVPMFGALSRYLTGDFNMDVNVYLNDNNTYWVPNFGLTNVLP